MNTSMDISAERVCYVHCNFCNTILAVSVPCSSMFTIVTVRCGHCANLLSVNMGMGSSSPTLPPHQDHLLQLQRQQLSNSHQPVNEISSNKQAVAGGCSASTSNKYSPFQSSSTDSVALQHQQQPAPRIPPIRSPEKRQRVPSAYNKFIREEIQRIKASNPEISHREAFSMAAKNWAHFPHIHFGLNIDGQKQTKLDHSNIAGEGTHMSHGFH
ncbi:hypothetical protein Ancab_011358 [Ancistrocladus abbreviatus]